MIRLKLNDVNPLQLNLKDDKLRIGLDSSVVANYAVRAGSADRLTTPRNIELAGDVTGIAQFDGSGDIIIDTTFVGLDAHDTAYWNAHRDYIPALGEVIIYTDRRIIDGITYAGIKIGDGNAYLIDLPFLGDDGIIQVLNALNAHIQDTVAHVTQDDRDRWDAKLNYDVNDEILVFTRN